MGFVCAFLTVTALVLGIFSLLIGVGALLANANHLEDDNGPKFLAFLESVENCGEREFPRYETGRGRDRQAEYESVMRENGAVNSSMLDIPHSEFRTPH